MSLNKSPPFSVRRIANRNPRWLRALHRARRRAGQLALIALLAVVGVSSLLIFSGGIEGRSLQAAATQVSTDKTRTELEGAVDYWEREVDKGTSGAEEELAKAKLDLAPLRLEDRQNSFLGSGFEKITDYEEGASNRGLAVRGKEFDTGGVGIINAVLYNLKDYFKFIAGGIAILWMLIAALSLITATNDEGIQKAKKTLRWTIMALLAIFMVDVVVTAFYESGSANLPGESLFDVDKLEDQTFMRRVAEYFQTDMRAIFSFLKTVAGAFAILFIFMAGVHLITAGGNEEGVEKEKKYLMHAITAFVTLLMLEFVIFDFIYPTDVTGLNSPVCVEFLQPEETRSSGEVKAVFGDDVKELGRCRSAAELGKGGKTLILGFVRFFESIVGGVAVFFIVYSGIRIIASFGNEEELTKNKKILIWSLSGLAVIMLSHNLVLYFFFRVNEATGEMGLPNYGQGLSDLGGVINFLASFVGIFSVVSILIAGIIWVANFGNTEVAEKAKKIILGAVIGVVLSISAYALVNAFTRGNPNAGTGAISWQNSEVEYRLNHSSVKIAHLTSTTSSAKMI